MNNAPLPQVIPAPSITTSVEPDKYTRKAPDFGADEHADYRVLHCNTKWLRYGTDDKAHAAALVLSACLLLVAVIIAIIGTIGLFAGREAPWLATLITWIGNAFLFTAGVAVGKSGPPTRDKEEEEKEEE
jgi:hypothetical protein